MRARATDRQLATQKKNISTLLEEAVALHREHSAACDEVAAAKHRAIEAAWQTGIRLNEIKAIVGHGNWQTWLDLNFCQPLGVRYEVAALYMRIDAENPNVRRVADLKFDTIRQYAHSFIPKKRLALGKDHKFPRSVSFLNIANEFSRLEHRHVNGLELVDFDEAREETTALLRFLKWLHGEIKECPWKS
jgi:hypothetical protein